MKHLTQAQHDELVTRAQDAEARAAFLLTMCREAQALCAAAQERCRKLGDATGAGSIAIAFRAFEIADREMFVALDSYGLDWDEHGVACTLCDGAGEPVADLAHARPELKEAVEWLVARGYIEVVGDVEKSAIVRERPEFAQ